MILNLALSCFLVSIAHSLDNMGRFLSVIGKYAAELLPQYKYSDSSMTSRGKVGFPPQSMKSNLTKS